MTLIDQPFAVGLTREGLYQQVGAGARLDVNYLLLVFLSTVVAAIGLAENSAAVVIGAMVIAPFLGPLLAFDFATAIGEHELMFRAITTSLIGLGFSLALGIAIGFAAPVNLHGTEITMRTMVGFDSIACPGVGRGGDAVPDQRAVARIGRCDGRRRAAAAHGDPRHDDRAGEPARAGRGGIQRSTA